MTLRRVAITGVGGVSPLGGTIPELVEAIEAGRCATRRMEGWERYTGLRSLVAAPAELRNEKLIPRQKRRSMGRMSLFAVQAAQQALADGAVEPALLTSGRLGCVVGSTTGSAISLNQVFETMLPKHDISELSSSLFFHCVSHSAAMNVAQGLGLNGCVMATSAACASALQAIGAGYDLIRLGRQDLMLCGGAEELHPTVTGSFDMLFATSTGHNDSPQLTPRPFDRDRDGLVCGEGSGIVLLEDLDRALKRNAPIYAEILGYHTCSSGDHVSESNREAMIACMRQALDNAGIGPGEADYLNAHATATLQGDKEEADAIREVFGPNLPVSSLKGHIGHTLGASAALELIVSLAGMRKGLIYPTLHLDHVDPACDGIHHVMHKPESRTARTLVKNSFAFGGICSALICKLPS